jgi:hypothetical protein
MSETQEKEEVEKPNAQDIIFKGIIEGFPKLTKETFVIKPLDPEKSPVTFYITKLSPRIGFNLFESMRYTLASNADATDSGSDEQNTAMMIKALLTLPPEKLIEFTDILFAGLQFKNDAVEKGVADFLLLEDLAMKDLQPLDIYELFIRCVIVNFYGSFRAMLSKFPEAERLFIEWKQKMCLSS